MKLSEQEKAAKKAAFRAMPTAKKLEHIFTYYKWPILLALIALFILGTTLRRTLTQKEPVLYLALVNVGVGSEMENSLNDGFLRYTGADRKRQEVYLYRDLYLSENADTLPASSCVTCLSSTISFLFPINIIFFCSGPFL